MLKRQVVNSTVIVILIGLYVLGFVTRIGWWPFVLALLVWLCITIFGSFFMQYNYHLKALHSNKDSEAPHVAITFDDGPNTKFTPKILDLLKHHNAKGSFFCIGQQIEKHPEILKRIISEGHTIGNHTYTHSKSFGFFNVDKVKVELQKTNTIVKDLTGLQMNLYRPAFGVTNPKIEKAIVSLKLSAVGWNVRSLDTTSRSEANVLKRITTKISKGDIVLLHDTSDKTIAVLEQLLIFLDDKKLESVTVDQLLNIRPYA